MFSGVGTNLYSLGYGYLPMQPQDYSNYVLMGVSRKEKKKYLLQHTQLMHEVLVQKHGDIDVLDWLVLGKHYTKNGEEEIAF